MAAALTLEQVLGYVYLTGLIKNITTGIPDVLPAPFKTIVKKTLGIQGRYTRVQGTRATARLVQYGSPGVRRATKGIDSQDVKLLSSKETFFLNYLALQTLRNYTNYDLQARGLEEIERQQMEFRALFDNLRLAATYSMLANGKIWWDKDGNLLPSSSGAQETTDFLMNANNQTQLNGIISSSWKNFNTDIPGQLRALKQRAALLTGYPLKYAFYGINVPSYMTANNYVLDYLARSPVMRERYVDSAELPDGLFDFTWVPVYTAFYQDANGTNQTFFGGDTVVFTPEIDQSWYEMMEGTDGVPSTFAPAATMQAALATIKEVQGMYSYGVATANPVGAEMLTGDNFSPILKVPDAIYEANVAP
jgi:hypothetical protein